MNVKFACHVQDINEGELFRGAGNQMETILYVCNMKN